MSNREFNATRTMLANAMATAGAELLEYMNVGAALAAIPNTEPQQYVVAGTLAMIGKLLPTPAAAGIEGLTRYGVGSNGEPYAIITGKYYLVADVERLLGAHAPVAAKLTDERIGELWVQAAEQFQRHEHGVSVHPSIHLARAIESEVLAHAGVGATTVTDEMVEAAIKAFNVFPCPENGSIARSWNRDHMRAALASAMKVATPSPQAQAAVSEQTAAEIRAKALEEAAQACDVIYQDHRDQYKGRGKYAPNNPRRADPHCDGCADGPGECASAIRELATKEAAAAEAPSQWQTMATVPMDGSEVLLYLPAPYDRIVKARWFDLWENWIEGEFPDPQDEYCGIGSRLPTHWMPLPDAPTQQQSAQGENGGEA